LPIIFNTFCNEVLLLSLQVSLVEVSATTLAGTF